MASKNGKRIAQNIINKYGMNKFVRLIEGITNEVPGPVLAEEFGVTRQRISQWRLALVQSRKATFEFRDLGTPTVEA